MTDTTFGRYEIRGELGRGGMATVYHAFDPHFQRHVALKILPRVFMHDENFRERFIREARAVAALEHWAIVPVHDYGEQDEQPFFVMRYMIGGSLLDRIQQGRLTLEEITPTIERIAAALDFAHRRDVIHRDVKPANILFDESGDAYLSDFGIVKLAEATAQLTGSGIVGTPTYMAPEMVYRGGVTPLIDVYALGVTLFQALAGEPPYEADTPMGTALAHTTQPIPQIGDWNPDLPAGIQAVIEGALAKDPADRYQSAGALAADLRGIASQGQPLPVLETTPVESPPEPTIQEPSPPAALEVTLPDAPPEMPEVTLPDAAPAAPTPGAAQQTAVPRATPLPPAVVKPVSRRFPVWLVAVLGLVIVAGLAFAFWPRGGGSAGEPPAEEPVAEQPTVGELAGEPVGEPIKVGLSFADFANERWQNEEILMRGMLEDLGYEVLSQEASQDAQLQNDQIDNMVAQGVEALIVIPEDGDAIVTATDRAAEAGVIVLAYDRLIKSPNIAAYVSFNNVEVGRQQALGVMEALDIENWDVAANGPARVVKLGGSPTDNNAILFRRGQDEILDPLVDEGKIEIVADQWVDNWDAAIAQGLMEDILAAAGNDIDAVVASNDYTALGALQALRARGLAGKVPISGQDATADGCNSIARGELTVTILKDIRDLSPLAVNLVDRLLKGETVELENYSLAGLTNDESLSGEVPCRFLPVYQVNADNVYELVVKSGFQAYGDVYRDIPAGDRPPRP